MTARVTARAAHSNGRSGPESATAGNVRGGTGDVGRGAYCTPKFVADALGPLDLDPFSNERSHIRAAVSLKLDRREDGFGDGTPGSFWTHESLGALWNDLVSVRQLEGSDARAPYLRRVTAGARTWIQPDYVRDFVLRAIRHYVHTRYVALLRFDPRPEWHSLIGEASEWVGVLSNSPGRSSFEFEFPPGYEGAGNTFPHALYARSYLDVTPEMRRLCCYPDGSARHWRKRSALADSASIAAFSARWGFDASRFAVHP